MNKDVLTLPLNESSVYTHQYGVYSIQKHRRVVEPLCQNPDKYLAFRQTGGSLMHWLYQVSSPVGMQLHPQRPLGEQLRELGIQLPVGQQIRLAEYMKAVAGKLGGAYREEQLFYLLTPWQGEGNAPLPPLGPLPRKPRPVRPTMGPLYYSLADLLSKRLLD